MSDLKLAIFCGSSPRHMYVANMLCKTANTLAIVVESRRPWTRRKLLDLLDPGWVWRALNRRWLRYRYQLVYREAEYFFGNQVPNFDREDLVSNIPDINDFGVVEMLKKIQPDLICVFNASLLQRDLLDIPRLGVLNLHGGLAPEYRGSDATFWALYYNQPHKVGCTIHYVDSGIDTGSLVAHICPEIRENDDELRLYWRAIKEAAPVYGEAVLKIEKSEPLGCPQHHKGRLFLVKDRQRRHERQLQKNIKEGMLKGMQLPKRVKWYYNCAFAACQGTGYGKRHSL